MHYSNRPLFYPGWGAGIAALALGAACVGAAEAQVKTEGLADDEATASFAFTKVARPSVNDAATGATFQVIDGSVDANSGGAAVLNDNKVPAEDDQPRANFFFAAGSKGGRLGLDLGKAIDVREVNTFSWHPAERAPQVYNLYASDGQAAGFNATPKRGTDPAACGWHLVAKVDTRASATNEPGGQWGVSVAAPAGQILGACRYLLFDIFPTSQEGAFGQTFYSEIDVVDAQGAAPQFVPTLAKPEGQKVFTLADGTRMIFDTSETPDLRDWALNTLAPVAQEWYPKLAAMLPSEGYTAPKKVSIVFFDKMPGVADTAGTRIRCAAPWFRQNLKGEAVGSVVHELVHVVQQYGRARRQPGAQRNPGWLVEGLTDYVRWYHYEPQSKGAEITTRRQFERARYDASYRVTANFLNYVAAHYNHDLIQKLNAAMRESRYSEKLWADLTGKKVEDLGAEWKKDLESKLTPAPAATNAPAATPPVDPPVSPTVPAAK